MMRNLDQGMVEGLKEVTLSSLFIIPVSPPSLPPDFRFVEGLLESGQQSISVRPLNEVSVAGYALIHDIHHRAALLLRVEMPRAVFQRGITSLQYLLVTLCIASLVFGLTNLLLLHRAVLAPLTHLSTEVRRIRKQKNLSERVVVEGRDEIARLGRAVNHMLDVLQASAGLEQINEALRNEARERLLAESAREEATKLALLAADIGASLTKATSMRLGLEQSAEAFVRSLDLRLARVWTFNEAQSMPVLAATAEMSADLDGPNARAPVCTMEISQIARSRIPHITNDALNDLQVDDREWLTREGAIAFAGYPLIVEERVVGVVAAFARHFFTPPTLECFSSVADQLAQFIQRMRVQEELQSSNEHLQQLFATIPIPVWLRDRSEGRFLEVNDAAMKHYGYCREEFLRMRIADILAPEEIPEADIDQAINRNGRPSKQKHRVRGGQIIDVEVNAHLVDFTGIPTLLVAAQDVTERNRMEVELLHGQKLQAVGGLAAGVAHEINTPIQFVGDNVRFLRDAFSDMAVLLGKYAALYAGVLGVGMAEVSLAEVEEARQKCDLEFLSREVPQALEQTLDGVNRVATIVQALKTFSHVDLGPDKKAADLNSAIQSTIVVARNELKYVADVETSFADLPPITCHLGDMNQVFLNLLVNAAHSIGEVIEGTHNKGRIRVETQVEAKPDGDWAVVIISDTGKGIPEEIQSRIFEPFFTTKKVGKGSGQGLALARAIVMEKHGGSLSFETESGKGTTFYVRIPANGTGAAPSTLAAPK
jgi:PAS domain S-box-containing protein